MLVAYHFFVENIFSVPGIRQSYVMTVASQDLFIIVGPTFLISVLYLGTLVELTSSAELYANPRHPYTKALLSAIPIPDPDVERERENQKIKLEGEVPSPINTKPGCKFQGRCRYAMPVCREKMPDLVDTGDGHFVACHLCSGEKKA